MNTLILTKICFYFRDFQDPEKMFFAMTYASNGDLLKFIDKMAERDIDCVQFYAAELLAAVEFLHFKVSPLELSIHPIGINHSEISIKKL